MITLITSNQKAVRYRKLSDLVSWWRFKKAVRYRGTVLVETAIVIVLLLMLTVGMMGFGLLFLRAEKITNAARHGARLACVAGLDDDDYPAVASSIDTYLTSQGIAHDNTTIGPGLAIRTVKATVYGKDLDILKLGNISFMGWFPNDFNASVTMAKEGP